MSIILNYCNHRNAYEQEGKRNRNDKKPHLSETHTVSFPSLVIDQIFKRQFPLLKSFWRELLLSSHFWSYRTWPCSLWYMARTKYLNHYNLQSLVFATKIIENKVDINSN